MNINPGDEAFISCKLEDESVVVFHMFPFASGYTLTTWNDDEEEIILCEDFEFETAMLILKYSLPKGNVVIDLIE